MLVLITLPLGISSLVLCQQSYDKLSDAVSNFDSILNEWQVQPISAITTVSAGGTCPSGYTDFSTTTWPEVSNKPCACPNDQYQPFNVATSTEYNTVVGTIYGRSGFNSVSNDGSTTSTQYVGAYESSYCSTSKSTTSHSTTQYASNRRRRASWTGGSYNGGLYGSTPECSGSSGDFSYSDTGGTCTSTASGTSASVSCTQNQGSGAACFVEHSYTQNTTTYYYYDIYTTTCGAYSIQDSTTGGCGTPQSKMKCLVDATVASSTMNEWRDTVICKQNSARQAIDSNGNIRPDPEDGSCPGGYTKCGDGDYNSNKATCTPNGTPCPITNIMVYQSSSSDYVSTDWAETANLGSGYILAWRYANTTNTAELPVTKTTLGFSNVCVNYQAQIDSAGLSGSTASIAWTLAYGSQCDNLDTRYTTMDSRTSQGFLQDNFDTQIASASSGNVVDWNDGTATTVGSQAYYLYNVASGSLSANSCDYCDTSDAICNGIMCRTLSTKLTAWATSNSNSGMDAKQAWMGEIFYKIEDGTCATKKDLWDAKPVIDDTQDAINAQRIMQYINFIGGVMIAIGCIVIDFQGMDDDSAADDCKQIWAHRTQNLYSCLFGIGTMVAMVFAFISVGKLGGVFVNADECTDSITSSTGGFSTLSDTVKEIANNTIYNLVIQSFFLLLGIYSACTAKAFSDDIPEDGVNMDKTAVHGQA